MKTSSSCSSSSSSCSPSPGASNVVDLAAVREDRFTARFYELMVGDLDEAAVAILETMPEDELELFFRLRKRVKERIANKLAGDRASRGLPPRPAEI